MKAITLWQPWCSLLAIGPKKYETRSWKTKHRGWIAIHAALRFDRLITDAHQRFEKELKEMGIEPIFNTPRGAVVAVAKLTQIVFCGSTFPLLIKDRAPEILKYGDYSQGRYAWIFSEIIPVEPAIPATGGQRIWNWEREIDDIFTSIPFEHLKIMDKGGN